MGARLYMLAVSHPAHAARRMLEHKGIAYKPVYLLPGFHPLMLRAAGFGGPTVPALELDGRKVQGSRKISRALDEVRPEPRLFPREREARAAVEEAERWGEEELQELGRRIFRWATAYQQPVRRWLGEIARIPAPGLVGALNAPVAKAFARRSGADAEQVRRDVGELPAMLDRVDRLIESGTIGGSSPNAADFQIGSSVRVLMAFQQLRPAIEDRPAGALALRLFPRYHEPIPAELPARPAGVQ